MKKIVCLFLSAILLSACVIAAGCDTDKNESGSAIVWSALSTEKYMRDKTPETYTEAKLDFVGV